MVPATTTTPLNGVRLDAVGELAGACLEDSEKAQATWSASVTWNGGFRSEATIREFDAIPSDEPEGLGGDDSAPTLWSSFSPRWATAWLSGTRQTPARPASRSVT